MEQASGWLVFLLAAAAAGANVAGGALAVWRPRLSDRALHLGLAASGGVLLAVAFLHVIPAAIAATPRAGYLMAGGYFLVLAAEHAFAGHAHHGVVEDHGPHLLVGAQSGEDGHDAIRPGAAAAAAAGLLLHSVFDGAAIAAAMSAGARVGWLTFAAVAAHKLPEGFSLAAIMRGSQRSNRAAVAFAAGLGVACLLGAAAARQLVASGPAVEGGVLAVAAGMFVHIAASDLLPPSVRTRGLEVLGATAGGFAVVALADALLDAGLGR